MPHDCPIGEYLCYFPSFGPPITLNSELKQGQSILGYIGMTGRTTGPHLHLALSIYALDPIDVLSYYRPKESGQPVSPPMVKYPKTPK